MDISMYRDFLDGFRSIQLGGNPTARATDIYVILHAEKWSFGIRRV